MALDHPERVLKAAFLDILPTHHVWTDVSMAWAINSYHWMFMAQPYDFPERLLRGNEEYYIRKKLTKQGLGKGSFTEEEIREYVRVCTPEQIHGVCEDYRAAATIDFAMDSADFNAGRKVACPVLVLWGELGHTGKHYEPRAVWPRYCSNVVRMQSLPCGTIRASRRRNRPTRSCSASSLVLTYLGSSENPMRNSSTARAHWRPSRIAHTTSDWPRRMSPAANTLGTEVT